MQGKTIGAFALGFAVGALCISVGLWSAGDLKLPRTAQPQQSLTAPPRPGGLPDFQAENRPTALPAATIPASTALPDASKGEANRTVEEPGGTRQNGPSHLAMPIAGVDPAQLQDTFHQQRAGHMHEALDIMAPRGTPVMAVVEGNVAKLFTSKQGGLTVYQFDNSGTYCYYYAHLDHYAPGLKEGTLLRKGDVLGFVGSTGDASQEAPHLHLAVFKLGPEKEWWKGTAIDPLPLLRESR